SAIPLPMSPHPSTATLRISAMCPPSDFRSRIGDKPAGIWGLDGGGSTAAGQPILDVAQEPAPPLRGGWDERLAVLQPVEQPLDLDARPCELLAELAPRDREPGRDTAAQRTTEGDDGGRSRADRAGEIDREIANRSREAGAHH